MWPLLLSIAQPVMRFLSDTNDLTYVDTPRGLFTASGVWFRTTEAQLKAYAGPVLRHTPLQTLLQQAEAWLRSPQTFTLWALPLLLLLLPPAAAAGVALLLYVVWRVVSPVVVSWTGLSLVRWLAYVPLQGGYYVLMLSFLAGQERIAAVVVGLAGFILMRWGLLAKAVEPLVRSLQASLYPLPAPDQILRALIVRTALRYDLSLPDLDRLKQAFFEKRGAP